MLYPVQVLVCCYTKLRQGEIFPLTPGNAAAAASIGLLKSSHECPQHTLSPPLNISLLPPPCPPHAPQPLDNTTLPSPGTYSSAGRQAHVCAWGYLQSEWLDSAIQHFFDTLGPAQGTCTGLRKHLGLQHVCARRVGF